MSFLLPPTNSHHHSAVRNQHHISPKLHLNGADSCQADVFAVVWVFHADTRSFFSLASWEANIIGW